LKVDRKQLLEGTLDPKLPKSFVPMYGHGPQFDSNGEICRISSRKGHLLAIDN